MDGSIRAELKRRDVLKRGAVGAGALFVGGGLASSAVAGQPARGMAYSFNNDERGEAFTVEDNNTGLTRDVNCEGNSEKTFQVVFTNNGSIYIPPNKHIPLGDYAVKRVVQECAQVELPDGPGALTKIQYEPA